MNKVPRSITLAALLALPLCACPLLGCNMLTGADQFVVDGDGGDGDGDGDGDGNGNGNGNGNGSGGGGLGGAGQGGSPVVDTSTDATGMSVERVDFYQAVKSTVFENGSAQSPSVRLVANRPAVVRVFVGASGATGAPVTARLTLGSSVLETPVTVGGGSSDQDFGSTVNFDVPANMMTPGVSWRVQLLEDQATAQGANPAASTPESSLTLTQSHALKVTIIPISYGADGSNRMPDTSAAQLENYRAAFMTLYPTTEVQLELGPVMGWNGGIYSDGSGWDSLLNSLSEERQGANAEFDEYYYGVFEPSSTFGGYCGGGCVSGLGFIGDPNGEYSRAAIGLGYSGDVAIGTAIHEVGHNHGRPHSPCGGVSGADQNFPHSGGSIGTWGMNIFSHGMVSPETKDFMGYCDPIWISDYVYDNILSFMQSTGTQSLYIPEESMNQSYERIAIGGSGSTFLSPLTLERPPFGTLKSVDITLEDGSTATVQGTFYAYDHLPGGVLFVKQQQSLISSASASFDLGTGPQPVSVTR